MVKVSCNNVLWEVYIGVSGQCGAPIRQLLQHRFLCYECLTGVPSLLCFSVGIDKWIKMLLKLLIILDDNLHQLEKSHQTREKPCSLGVVYLFPHSDGVLE